MTKAHDSANTLALADPDPDLETLAVEACRKVHRLTTAAVGLSEERLRGVRAAGVCLDAVQRTRGGRPAKNSVRSVTGFQEVLHRAQVSRPTASRWQKVARVAEETFEQFLQIARDSRTPPTIEDLLDFAFPAEEVPPDPNRKTRTVKLLMSARDYQRFTHQIDQLRASLQAETFSAAVLELTQRAHAEYWRAQLHPHDHLGGAARAA